MAVVTLSTVPQPPLWHDVPSVTLSDQTLRQRKARVLAQMRRHDYDTLIVYADKEHGGNFEYLTGFIPRFEEALLVLHREGEAVLVLGNENLKLAAFARLENHYFAHGCFLEDGQLLRDRPRIEHIPAVIVQGRYDMVCPPISAWELADGWDRAELRLVPASGHALSEPRIGAELVRAMDGFRDIRP